MKKYYLTILYVLELLFALINISFFCFLENDYEQGLLFTEPTVFIPITTAILIIMLYALEFLKSKPFKRLIFFFIAFIVCFLTNETINLVNSSICIFSLIYTCIMLVIICRKSSKSPQKIKVIQGDKNTLPMGYFSKKDLIIFYILLLLFASTIFFIILFYKNIYCLIIFSFFLIIIVLSIFYCFNHSKIRILLKIINKELSFEKFLIYINKLENSKDILHFETYNFLKIIKANYYFVYDIDESLKIFESCLEPTFKNYKDLYEVVKIEYFINKGDVENAKIAYEETKNNRNIKNSKFPYLFDALFSESKITNIEKIFTLNNKLRIVDCINLNTLMLYYKKRNNITKAQEYAKKMSDMHTDFKTYNTLANQILNEENIY